MDFFDAHP
jgi:hypothetical protein